MLRNNKQVNPLLGTGTYNVTSNHMKLVHWQLIGGLLHLVQRGGDWAGPQPAHRPLLVVPNVTGHPSTASVPITVMVRCFAVLMSPLKVNMQTRATKSKYVAGTR